MSGSESQGALSALRDEVDGIVRTWHMYEVARGGAPIIDYDLQPHDHEPAPPASTDEVVARLQDVAARTTDTQLLEYVNAHIAFGQALTSGNWLFADFVKMTQGVWPRRWPPGDVEKSRSSAASHLAQLGIELGPQTRSMLNDLDRPLQSSEVEVAILEAASDLRPQVSGLVGELAPFDVEILLVQDPSVYWAYWIDGAGSKARLRINESNASFTDVTAVQFALHEVLGHAAQAAGWARELSKEPDAWPRTSCLHTPQQVILEGWAQALPLYLETEDHRLTARVRLLHYVQISLAQAHMNLQEGASPDRVRDWLREQLPWLSAIEIDTAIRDRLVDPQTVTYLWSYPVGLDWFIRLRDSGLAASADLRSVMYRQSLSPIDAQRLSPDVPIHGID